MFRMSTLQALPATQQRFLFNRGGAFVRLPEGESDQFQGAFIVVRPVLIPFGQFDQGEQVAGLIQEHLAPEPDGILPAAGALVEQ